MNKVSIYKVQLIKESTVDFDNLVIRSPDDAAHVARKFYEFAYGGLMPDREVSVGIWLNTKNIVCGIEVISIGSLNAAVVHPREVFVGAIIHKAASIIFVHNHPSGDVTPSPEDINITMRLKEAGEIIGIELLDHLIIGDDQYCSLKERGDF